MHAHIYKELCYLFNEYFCFFSLFCSQILIFPEGTDFNVSSKRRSDAFAAKQSLMPFSYVLHPRTTGFSFLVSQLQEGKNFDFVGLCDNWNIVGSMGLMAIL